MGNGGAGPGGKRLCETFTVATPRQTRRYRAVIDARRRCLVCDWEENVTEPAETDVVGPPCSRCLPPSDVTFAWSSFLAVRSTSRTCSSATSRIAVKGLMRQMNSTSDL